MTTHTDLTTAARFAKLFVQPTSFAPYVHLTAEDIRGTATLTVDLADLPPLLHYARAILDDARSDAGDTGTERGSRGFARVLRLERLIRDMEASLALQEDTL